MAQKFIISTKVITGPETRLRIMVKVYLSFQFLELRFAMKIKRYRMMRFTKIFISLTLTALLLLISWMLTVR